MLKQLRKRRNQKGFTLVELLVVIAIIGILAAIAIPQFSEYRKKGYKAATISDGKNAYTAIEAWRSDNPGLDPVAETIGPEAVGTKYKGIRTSKGVTVAIAAGGAILATHTQYPGYKFEIDSAGKLSESGL